MRHGREDPSSDCLAVPHCDEAFRTVLERRMRESLGPARRACCGLRTRSALPTIRACVHCARTGSASDTVEQCQSARGAVPPSCNGTTLRRRPRGLAHRLPRRAQRPPLRSRPTQPSITHAHRRLRQAGARQCADPRPSGHQPIMRQGVPAIINPFDLFALEEALRIKDRTGARVTVISMGPPAAEAALKKCVSFGADDAVPSDRPGFAGADTLATTFVLAVRGPPDRPRRIRWTSCSPASRPSTATPRRSGPGIAIRLGWQLLTYVSKLRSDRHGHEADRRSSGAPKAACRCWNRGCRA